MKKDDQAVEALSRARLQRFYGGDPLAWEDMPLIRLKEFADAMPIIMAEERLAYIMDTAVGSGAARKGTGSPHIRKLDREASRGSPRQKRRGGKVDLAALRRMGIETPNG